MNLCGNQNSRIAKTSEISEIKLNKKQDQEYKFS